MKTIEEMKARLGEIIAKLGGFEGVETLTAEIIEEVNTLNDEALSLKNEIEAREKMEAIKALGSTSARQVAPVTPEVANVIVGGNRQTLDPKAGFKTGGEFFQAVRKFSNGVKDARFDNAMFEKHGQDGGFLVPEEFMTEIQTKVNSDESLLGKTRQFTISGNSLTLPTDEKQPWTGGAQAYWMGEGKKYTESQGEFGQASFRLHKLGVLMPVSDELLEDAQAIESYIRMMAPEAIMHKINEAILTGNGTAKPTGILSSDFKVVVAKEAAQTADTIVARNVIKMYSKMVPNSRANAVWYINPMVEEQLRTMTDDNGNFIYLAPGSQMNQTPYGLLLGRPVLPLLGGMKELGTEGDIIFADLNYYYSIIKAGGIKSAVSQHLYFDLDKSAYKFTMRIDGKCPFKSPITTQYGNYEMSGFVTLADRA